MPQQPLESLSGISKRINGTRNSTGYAQWQKYYPEGLNELELATVLSKWQAGGGTYLWQRIIDDLAVNVSPDETVQIIVITDGEDSYGGSFAQLQAFL